MLKKVLSLFAAIFLFAQANVFADVSQQYDYYLQDFVVSAYYSPLPNQVRYMRGSYEADMILNGRGTNGADGTPVFIGMLAAPKSYPFGTKIDLPGLGIGAVHDRGGAIIEKADYDRIDVWMGHGDEGLTRALNWGMRSITGKVFFEKNAQVSLNYSHIPSSTPKVAQQKQAKKAADTFTVNLQAGAIHNQVPQLKRLLNELGYFHGELRNNYFGPDLEEAVVRFQVDKGVVASASSYGAGSVGAQTRAVLNSGVQVAIEEEYSEPKTLSAQTLQLHAGMGKNATGDDVKKLQQILQGLGFYNGPLTGEYNEDTIAAVFAFQRDQAVVSNETELGAGYFGKKTKSALESALTKRQEKIAAFPVKKYAVFEGEEKEPVVLAATITATPVNFPDAKFLQMSNTMYLGKTGDDVEALQKTLAQEGFLAYEHVTGYFGPITSKAVEMAKGKIF